MAARCVQPPSAHLPGPNAGLPSIEVLIPEALFGDYATAQAAFQSDLLPAANP